MKRPYITGEESKVNFFTGIEVEHTLAHGLKTLFVVGIQDPDKIINIAEETNCQHIYLGANQSFNPSETKDWQRWDNMIFGIQKSEFLHTIDFDVRYINSILDSCWFENNRIIPMISVKLPYIDQLGYNAHIKLDDKDFDSTNPGVWVHHLNSLKDQSKFTHWHEYKNDKPTEVR